MSRSRVGGRGVASRVFWGCLCARGVCTLGWVCRGLRARSLGGDSGTVREGSVRVCAGLACLHARSLLPLAKIFNVLRQISMSFVFLF